MIRSITKRLIADKFLAILLPIVFILYSIWALIIPFGQAPDEPLRFDIGNFIYKYHELPILGDPRLTDFGHGISYASLPQLPYIIGGVMMIIASPFIDSEHLFLVHRLVSVISSVLAIWFAYQICRRLGLSNIFCYFTACLLAFIPQFAFISAYVNQEAFSIMVGLMTVYFWLRGHDNEWKLQDIILVGISSSLVLLTYLNGYVVLPTTILFLIWSTRKKSISFYRTLLIYSVVVFIGAAWWFIRNAYLYGGDFIGLSISAEIANQYPVWEARPENRMPPVKQGLSIFEFFSKTNFLEGSYISFWAAFGWMDVWMEYKYYSYIKIMHAISFIGVLVVFVKMISDLFKKGVKSLLDSKLAVCIILFAIIVVETFFLSSYYSYASDFQSQGRYLFPAIFQTVFFITLGFNAIISSRLKKWMLTIGIACMFILNIYSLYDLVLLKYYI